MRTPENMLTPTQAAKEWGVTRMWIYMCVKEGRFADAELLETPWGTLVSREGLARVLGPPDPNRIAPNAGPRKRT
jgi:hypothetical protein